MMSVEIVKKLADEWKKSGIALGDTVLLHSSAKRTLRRIIEVGATDPAGVLLQSFLTAVGTNGTLVFPLFNFDFTRGAPFDIRTTKSQMGALSEAARQHPEAFRSGHPIYSFAAIGKDAKEFEVDNYSGYGPDSPFAVLHNLRGKIAVLDLPDQNSMTFYHYVEETLAVPYRYHKEFSGRYTGRDGNAVQKSFGLFVRDIENGVTTHVDPMGEKLWNAGLYTGNRPTVGSGLRTIRAATLFIATKHTIETGGANGMLYRIENA